MSENPKNLTHVVAKLIAKYDISPEEAPLYTSIHYLCIYEFEYSGKKYKYRTHQIGDLPLIPIPETIELCFIEDPNKARKVTDYYKNEEQKSSSNFSFFIFILIGLTIIIFALSEIYKLLNEVLSDFNIINIPFILIFICLYILIEKRKTKIRKKLQNRDAMIEDAMLNNRTAIAYLTKTRHHVAKVDDWQSPTEEFYRQFPYEGKYTYNYNGKKYNKTFPFSVYPPHSIRVFFNKNAKDVFTFITKT